MFTLLYVVRVMECSASISNACALRMIHTTYNKCTPPALCLSTMSQHHVSALWCRDKNASSRVAKAFTDIIVIENNQHNDSVPDGSPGGSLCSYTTKHEWCFWVSCSKMHTRLQSVVLSISYFQFHGSTPFEIVCGISM